ncbi:SDR family oxidoreductase [Roseibium suaedae]|uniref:3-oxoacyl-[acyl-carrier protein] reductase n=1 Tax=Roseibium suaedae TaxID=735517 RepID=A0A1M7FLR8_9HYPH|nr:SDR family oxidoreductase [Roseibium suaedae]SHM05004.1 3-oxoacyl-[acyl-carrier protein] reductase [Roseibium suaedae]
MSDQQTSAIVTGASRGIGAQIARQLAADGFAVAVNYSSSPEQAQAVVSEIEAAGGRAAAIKADLADPAAARSLFDQAEALLGPVSVLVNNAGMMKLAPLAQTGDEMLEAQLDLNLAAPIRLIREAAARLPQGGRIINLSSSVVGFYQPGYGAYAASKAGVEAITHIAAKELGPKGVTVNAIAPGPVGTDLFLEGKSTELVEQIKRLSPFGRLGTPEDIANAVSFLASPQSAWISGQIIRANGGAI